MMTTILTIISVVSALTVIFLILLHSGRGGGLSDMFGGGQLGGSMAGSTVVERNLDRLTIVTAVITSTFIERARRESLLSDESGAGQLLEKMRAIDERLERIEQRLAEL